MRLGRTVIRAEPGTWADYMLQVVQATSELFFLLEGAERIEAQFSSGERGFSFERGFAPSPLSMELLSHMPNQPVTWASELGCNGRMVQLAYLGWIARVDGAWEKYRKKQEFGGEKSPLPHGVEASLWGDLHKIRNDLLKNRGRAQRKNTGRCELLRWFKAGDRIHLKLDHVLDFLHHLGTYQSLTSVTSPLDVCWCIRDEPPAGFSFRILSNRAFIESIPEEHGSGFGLFISIVFSDGIPCSAFVRRADEHADLMDQLHAIQGAPTDEFGALILPGVGTMDATAIYAAARRMLSAGDVPIDPGTPRIRFR